MLKRRKEMKKLFKVLLLTILCVVLLAACQTVPTDGPNGGGNPPVEDTTKVT